MVEKSRRCIAQERLIRGKGRLAVNGLLDPLSIPQLRQVPDSVFHSNERCKAAAMGRLRPDEPRPQSAHEEHSPALLWHTELLSLEDFILNRVSKG